ncbi:MAG: putative bifunctional diguanylate cyclase/phosphodiesterase [Caulobacteraceae bacterium]
MALLRRLRVKLTLLYAGLFSVALILIGAIAYAVIAGNAQRMIREQLEATGVVFDRVWELRFEELRNGARLASLDYGFREAVASGDRATIGSALENLRNRLGADLVFLVSPNASIISSDGASGTVSADLQAALEQDEAPFGVLRVEGRLHQAVTMPVFAPNMLGWIVVGERLDGAEMRALQGLSSIPLQAEVVSRLPEGDWDIGRDPGAAQLGALIDRAVQNDSMGVFRGANGDAIALAKPLHSIDRGQVVLLLRYPMASAMQPYRALFGSLLAIGVVGVALLITGSWFLASGITRPLSSLSAAARQLQGGVYAPVSVTTSDEVSELADSFNAMIGALRDRERKIMQLAFHDSETRLPNRLALERRLAAAKPENLYLAVVGLDRFAQIRAAIGYAHAETLVKLIGVRLTRLAPHNLMARLSSDILALAYSASSDADALQRATFIASTLEQPLSLDGEVIDINVSIGVAQPRGPNISPGDMIRRGSIALDQARSAHEKRAIFDEATYGNPAHNLSLMGEMLAALENGAMYLTHQPKLDLRTRRITSVETLVRWRHGTRGLIPPDVFVPMAEETGQIRALTDWVLRKTIEEQAWLSAQGCPLGMSINISGRLLGDEAFAKNAIACVRNASGPICFEITETAVIDNPELALRHTEMFANHGVSIAIDDYGSGLSSLAYLRQLPAHELKIDKMFVENLTRGQRDALLVRSTIDLAHGLGLAVTAEGVEQPAALALLASMGCDMAQGYLIARPTPMEELPTLLQQNWSAEQGNTQDGQVAPSLTRRSHK